MERLCDNSNIFYQGMRQLRTRQSFPIALVEIVQVQNALFRFENDILKHS